MSHPLQTNDNNSPRHVRAEEDDGYPEDGLEWVNSRIRGLEAFASPEARHKVLPWLDEVPRGGRPDDERSFAGGSMRTGGILKRESSRVSPSLTLPVRGLKLISSLSPLPLFQLRENLFLRLFNIPLLQLSLFQRPLFGTTTPSTLLSFFPRYLTNDETNQFQQQIFSINWTGQQQTSAEWRGRERRRRGAREGEELRAETFLRRSFL